MENVKMSLVFESCITYEKQYFKFIHLALHRNSAGYSNETFQLNIF